MIACGCDLASILRWQNPSQRRLERIFSQAELQALNARFSQHSKSKAATLAGMFAAKEAIAKALGCGIGALLGWQDIEIIKDHNGAPVAKLTPAVIKQFKINEISLSISHEADLAMASCVILRD